MKAYKEDEIRQILFINDLKIFARHNSILFLIEIKKILTNNRNEIECQQESSER